MKRRAGQRRGMAAPETMLVVTIGLVLLLVLAISVLRVHSATCLAEELLRAGHAVEDTLDQRPEPLPPAAPPAEAAGIEVAVDGAPTGEPTGRIARLWWLAVAGSIAFGAGFWYLVEDRHPGWLDDLRLPGLLLLGLNHGLFYGVLAALGDRPDAVPLALAVALPLLGLHVGRRIGGWFALTRALPLALATFGVTVAQVDHWRPQVILGAVVAATTAVTLSWPGWSERRSHRRANLESAAARRSHLGPMVATATDVRRAVEDWSDRAAVARRTLDDLPGSGVERAAAVRAVQRLERALGSAQGLLRFGEWDFDQGQVSEWEMNLERRQPELRRIRALLDRIGPAVATTVEGLELAAAKHMEGLASAFSEMERAFDALAVAEVEISVPPSAPADRVQEVTALLGRAAVLREEARALAERAAGPHDPRPLAVQARQVARRAEGLIRAMRPAEEPSRCACCGGVERT